MNFTSHYDSPVGKLLLASDGEHLTGLWLEGQKFYGAGLAQDTVPKDDLPVFVQTKSWLEQYFLGKQPESGTIPITFQNSGFRMQIWNLLMEIPYGETVTYGYLAKLYEQRTGKKTAARAVGGAVGRNPISILVPCHRVVGAGGALTGYAAGTDRKKFLLEHENASSGR